MATVTEPSRKLKVGGSYDVVVVGGGIAGVAAAVAAARSGASVCLLEKMFGLGGLATLGNVIIYLPLCDGLGNKVIGGLGEEMLKLSVSDGYEEIPACWKRGGSVEERKNRRYRVNFNPCSYLLELEKFVLKNGVSLCYDTRLCEVIKKNGKISAVIIENKNGRQALKCKTVIDASGDADVCYMAGEETVSLDTNVQASWFYYEEKGSVNLQILSDPYEKNPEQIGKGIKGFRGDEAEQLTAQLVGSREMIRKKLKQLSKEKGTTIRPVNLTSIPDVRMTRRLSGQYELAEADNRKWFEDTIGMTGDWRRKGPVFCVPFSSLKAAKTSNLLAIGRCMSSANDLWDLTRVIPTCAVTGEAAGVAAAMAAGKSGNINKVELAALQAELKKRKVIINQKLL